MAVNRASENEEKSKAEKRATVARVLGYMKPYKAWIVFVICIMIISSVIAVLLPMLVENAIDVQVASSNAKGLVIVVCISIALSLIWSVLYLLRVRIMAKVSNEVVLTVRSDAFAHLQTLGLNYFDSRPTGKILSRLIGDITSLKDMLRSMVTNLVPNLFFVIVLVIVMFIKNALFSAAIMAILPILVIGSVVIMKKAFVFWQEYRQKSANVNAFSHETFNGIRVVQSFRAEQEMSKSFSEITADAQVNWRKAVKLSDSVRIIIDISMGLGMMLLYLLAIKTKASVGEVVAFTSYLGLFWQPIRQMANMYNQLGNQIAGAERVFEILDTKATLLEADKPIELPRLKGEVEFDNVSFSYPDDLNTLVLDNISFKAHSGQTIALVGPTGAGKTTIINLLARFYDPVKGTVRLDGVDISKASFTSLRAQIGVMTQDSYLFSGTIMENLRYGKLDATDDVIKKACQTIGAETFILATEKGYDTEVNDQSLSQGQRQLLALARTLISNPAILILDEATSAIDTYTELLVQRGIKILTEGRTSFVVAHRLSTIKSADCIMVIDHKGIVESGRHEELLAKGGEYAELYKAQFEL
jgi:ATP-binding cassette subfamily B multidrug efflux pump